MLRFLFMILFCVSFLSGCCGQSYIEHIPASPAKQRTINWQNYSNSALVLSTTMKKPALLYFTLNDCPVCELMEEETFTDPELVLFVTENFVPIKINATQKDMIDKYGVDRYPTIVILSSLKNSKLIKVTSVHSPEDLMEYLKLAARIDNALSGDDTVLEGLLKSL